jgi:fibronectin type 3 domain-containing protein
MKKVFIAAVMLCVFSAVVTADWDASMVRVEFDGPQLIVNWLPVTDPAPVTYTVLFAVYRSGVTLTSDAQWNALTAQADSLPQSVSIYADVLPLTYTAFYRIKKYTNPSDGIYSKTVSSSSPGSITDHTGYDSKVFLAWVKSADPDVLYYNVYRSTNPGLFDAVKMGNVSDTKIVDYSAANLIGYFYRIQPVSDVEGSFSGYVNVTPFAAPFAPSYVYVSPSADGTSVSLTWTATALRGSYDISGYNIYRSTSPITIADAPVETANSYYLDSSLIPGTWYNYQVKTVDIMSNTSAPYSFTVFTTGPPFAPVNVRAQSANASLAVVSWDNNKSSEAVIRYHIYETGLEKGTALASPYTDSTAVSGGKYLYTVKAENPSGLSPFSSAVAVTVMPDAPLDLKVLPGVSPGSLDLSWQPIAPIENVTGYNIYRALTPLSFNFSTPIVTNVTLYADIDVASGQNYFYTISGFSSVEGAMSITASAVPVSRTVQVSGLTATAFNGYALLDWDNAGPAYGVTGYNIYKSTDPSPVLFTYSSYVTPAAGTLSSGYVTGLNTLGIPYYLKVTALNIYGEGDTVNASYIDITMTSEAVVEKPENVTATSQGDGQINLAWNAASDSRVTIYNVYRSTFAGSYNYASPLTFTGNNSYIDRTTTAAIGVPYYYEIRSYGAVSESASSAEVSATAFYRPYPVNNLTASYINGNIWLLWSAPAQKGTYDFPTEEYRVYRSTTLVFPGTPLPGGGSLTAEQFVDSTIDPAPQTYYYKVTAFDAHGNESINPVISSSIEISSPQKPPATLVALAGDGKVVLIWKMVSPLYYNIYRREASNPVYGQPIAYNVSSTLKDYTDQNLADGTTYYYMIKAVNAAGEGPASMEVSATPYIAVTLPAGAAVTAVIADKKEVLVSWSPAISGSPFTLAGYYVMRSSDGGGSYSTPPITLTTQTNYLDNSTEWNKTYYYIVKTLDSGGNIDGIYKPVSITLPLPENKIRVFRNLMNLALGDTLKLRYVLTQNGRIKLRVYTLSGSFVTELVDINITDSIDSQNPYESADLYWDGTNKAGQKVASGVYILSLETPKSRVIEKVAVVK